MPFVRKAVPTLLILLVGGAAFWLGTPNPGSEKTSAKGSSPRQRQAETADARDQGDGSLTKVSLRGNPSAKPTHQPAQLQQFMLPNLAIENLTLAEALDKLLACYQETCLKTGETPLPLTFSIPSSADRRMTFYLDSQTFATSVKLLATLAGMKVKRVTMEYRFEPFPHGGPAGDRSIAVAPDFTESLRRFFDGPATEDSFEEPEPLSVRDSFAKLGLDPAIRLIRNSDGTLKIENASASELEKIASLASLISENKPAQLKVVAKLVELPTDSKWIAPDISQMDDAQVQAMMREFSQSQGVNLTTLPTVLSRTGHHATIEVGRELIIPTNDAGTEFESHQLGHQMSVQGSLLGFGQDISYHYTDATGGIDPATLEPVIENRVDVTSSGFTRDGSTQLSIQTRADGTRTLVMVASQQIDATGRPLK